MRSAMPTTVSQSRSIGFEPRENPYVAAATRVDTVLQPGTNVFTTNANRDLLWWDHRIGQRGGWRNTSNGQFATAAPDSLKHGSTTVSLRRTWHVGSAVSYCDSNASRYHQLHSAHSVPHTGAPARLTCTRKRKSKICMS